MSAGAGEPALALSFFDPDRGFHGTIRSGLTLLFDGRSATAHREPAEIESHGEGWRARVGDRVALELTPTAEAAELAGTRVSVCSVSGTVEGRGVEALGTAAESPRPPVWQELDSLRALSAVFGSELAALAIARRPRAAAGHGDELVTAALLEAGKLRSPEDARISTVYDGGGRQHSAGLELWFPGEDYPRRLFGTVSAGTSFELEQLTVHAAVFSWRTEGSTGAGLYELMLRRDDEPEAA